MAKQNVSFVDRYIEKIVLGVCALLFVGAVVYYFPLSPYQIDGNDPKKLCEAARTTAEETAAKVRGAPPYDSSKETVGKPAADALKALARWFGASSDGLIKIAELDPRAPRTQSFQMPLLPVKGVAEEDRHGLAKLIAPDPPVVTTGHTFMEIPTKPPELDVLLRPVPNAVHTESRERSWVSVASQVNLLDQFGKFKAARYPQGPVMSLPIVQVHLQRRLAGDESADWEDVTTYTPFKPLEAPQLSFVSGARLDNRSSNDLDKFRKLIRDGQDWIARPLLPAKSEGTKGDDPFAPPLPYISSPPGGGDSSATAQPPPRGGPGQVPPPTPEPDPGGASHVRDWLNSAQKALAGQKPFSEADPEMALILARAAAATKAIKQTDADRADKLMKDAAAACQQKKRPVPTSPPLEPEQLMPIVAHDLEVLPGRRYVYRIRYEIVSPFVGSERMKNPADAQKVTLFSEWSLPSREVEVKSDIYFYLTKTDESTKFAEFTVFKRIAGGKWAKEKFKASPGQPIGEKKKTGANNNVDFSTNMICVDIDFKPRGAPNDVSVVLASAGDGSLFERSRARDSADPKLSELSASASSKSR